MLTSQVQSFKNVPSVRRPITLNVRLMGCRTIETSDQCHAPGENLVSGLDVSRLSWDQYCTAVI